MIKENFEFVKIEIVFSETSLAYSLLFDFSQLAANH
jgi:hypothetical protein